MKTYPTIELEEVMEAKSALESALFKRNEAKRLNSPNLACYENMLDIANNANCDAQLALRKAMDAYLK